MIWGNILVNLCSSLFGPSFQAICQLSMGLKLLHFEKIKGLQIMQAWKTCAVLPSTKTFLSHLFTIPTNSAHSFIYLMVSARVILLKTTATTLCHHIQEVLPTASMLLLQDRECFPTVHIIRGNFYSCNEKEIYDKVVLLFSRSGTTGLQLYSVYRTLRSKLQTRTIISRFSICSTLDMTYFILQL